MQDTPAKIAVHALTPAEADRLSVLINGETTMTIHVYADGSIEIPLNYGCIRFNNSAMEVI